MVPPGRVELPLPKEEDFESTASTNSATEAHHIIENIAEFSKKSIQIIHSVIKMFTVTSQALWIIGSLCC